MGRLMTKYNAQLLFYDDTHVLPLNARKCMHTCVSYFSFRRLPRGYNGHLL